MARRLVEPARPHSWSIPQTKLTKSTVRNEAPPVALWVLKCDHRGDPDLRRIFVFGNPREGRIGSRGESISGTKK